MRLAVVGIPPPCSPSEPQSPFPPPARRNEPRSASSRASTSSGVRVQPRASDDPIVAPRRPGSSHNHSFVGNRTTNASSTLATLLGASSSCDRAGHTAAYWMPSLVVNGAAP